jgi:hypothetical protein
VGNQKERQESVLGLHRLPGCVGVNLKHCPKITQRHGRELLLHKFSETGLFLPTFLAEVIEKL